jgi:hypothetical protein
LLKDGTGESKRWQTLIFFAATLDPIQASLAEILEDAEALEATERCKDLFDGKMEAVNLYGSGAMDNDQQEDDKDNYDENLTNYPGPPTNSRQTKSKT